MGQEPPALFTCDGCGEKVSQVSREGFADAWLCETCLKENE